MPIANLQPRGRINEVLAGNRPAAGRNKFGAIPTETEHGKFASRSEASWVGKLAMLQDGGYIGNLRVDKAQLKYPLKWNDVLICVYEADAAFDVLKDCELPVKNAGMRLKAGSSHVVDVKGQKTPAYKLKAKMMLAAYGIKILEL